MALGLVSCTTELEPGERRRHLQLEQLEHRKSQQQVLQGRRRSQQLEHWVHHNCQLLELRSWELQVEGVLHTIPVLVLHKFQWQVRHRCQCWLEEHCIGQQPEIHKSLALRQ